MVVIAAFGGGGLRHLALAAARALGCIDIQLMPGCKCRFCVLPVLTYMKYAALRVTHKPHFDRWSASLPLQPSAAASCSPTRSAMLSFGALTSDLSFATLAGLMKRQHDRLVHSEV